MDKYLESLVLKGESEEIVEPVNEEEVVNEIAEALEAPAEEPVEEVQSEPESIEPEPAPVKEEKKTAKKLDNAVTESTYVTQIKIFNTPDPKGPFKIFTGNVIVKGEVGGMTELDYVKPGFGIVRGFTSDLK